MFVSKILQMYLTYVCYIFFFFILRYIYIYTSIYKSQFDLKNLNLILYLFKDQSSFQKIDTN